MATNFTKFREKMEAAKTTGKKAFTPKFHYAKLEAGKRHTFRFLPLKNEGLELPITIHHHHSLNFPDGHFESITCSRKVDGGDCPFCDEASRLWRKFTDTEEVAYKEAAKSLFAKTHYLLVGYEPSEIDSSDLKAEDVKIVRASSKSNMELIQTKLEKEVDFIDFSVGRDVTLFKSKSKGVTDITTITWDFDDPSVAFTGKNGKNVWDQLLELSPDLSEIVNPLEPKALADKFTAYKTAPVTADDADDEQDRRILTYTFKKPAEQVTKLQPTHAVAPHNEEELPFDIEDMRKELDLEN